MGLLLSIMGITSLLPKRSYFQKGGAKKLRVLNLKTIITQKIILAIAQLPVISYQLSVITVHCLLFTVHCSLFTVPCSLIKKTPDC
ncbi:MAG: hypothetical protein EAZ76_18780 [Nostocales cyanobacterium]|nr:MAG: hypothetical protein EAZ87_18040 [Nostocales cyanobacterium]TAF05879.1 MAG: hypothetical protein EAZ76_18780 [Nostocales cyanobacterium]